jgi:uncharacterized protein (TIGR02001 family)
MKKTVIAASLAALLPLSIPAVKAAEPTPEIEISGNVSLVSDYRFRGISQTDLKPALQGGFDLAHKSGFYVGTWASSISEFTSFNGAGLEIDFYGGYASSVGDLGYDVGYLYYYYPGAEDPSGGSKPNTGEVYLGLSYGPVSLKTSYSTSRYFGIPQSSGTLYYDLSASLPISDSVTFNAHVGYLDLAGKAAGKSISGSDYKVGLSADVGGFTLAADYVWNSGDWKKANEDVEISTGKFKDLGKGGLVLSLTKEF